MVNEQQIRVNEMTPLLLHTVIYPDIYTELLSGGSGVALFVYGEWLFIDALSQNQ